MCSGPSHTLSPDPGHTLRSDPTGLTSMCWRPGHAGIRPKVRIPSLCCKCVRKVFLRARELRICRLGLQRPCTSPNRSAFCQFRSENPRASRDWTSIPHSPSTIMSTQFGAGADKGLPSRRPWLCLAINDPGRNVLSTGVGGGQTRTGQFCSLL